VHQGWEDLGTLPAGADQSRTDEDEPDVNGNGRLDRQAGHGTFIAGLMRQHAPDATIHTQGVLSSFGDGDEYDISAGVGAAIQRGRFSVVNMSLGGYTKDDKPDPVMASAVAALQRQGAVVVAAAGNAGSCRRFWPACLPGVIAVGATFCGQRAWFSNFGPWVSAWAPGVDIVSTFYTITDPGFQVARIVFLDPLTYAGWALWSGTSFAAPQVAAAIARVMYEKGVTAVDAADEVLRSGEFSCGTVPPCDC
jgi:subtilisin family serine protease